MAGKRIDLEQPGPVIFDEEAEAWVVRRHEDVGRAIVDHENLSNDLWLRPRLRKKVLRVLASGHPIPPSIGSSDPPTHTRHRKLLNVALTPGRLEQLAPRIEAIAHALIDSFHDRGQVDLVIELCDRLPTAVFGLLTSLTPDEVQQLMEWRKAWIKLAWHPTDLETEIGYAHEILAMQQFFWDLVETRRDQPRDDVLGVMLRACLDGDEPLDHSQLVAELMGVLEAGQETVSGLIANCVYHLLREPERWAEVVAHPERIPAAIEETLRFDSGIRAVFRRAKHDVEIGGTLIPADSKVCLMLAAANRDPAVITDGERFDPWRAAGSHLAFGRGIHFCIGAVLARIEGRVAVESLVRRLPHARLAEGFVYESTGNLAFQLPTSLPLVWSPRGADETPAHR